MLAITPQAWEVLTEDATPLSQRFSTIIRLGMMDTEAMARLLKVYLARARRAASVSVADPLEPFSLVVIEQLTKTMPDRTPRNVLQLAFQVITFCVTNRISQINSPIIQRVLDDFLSMKAIESQQVGRR